jgi:hypothetical protein
MMRHDLGAVRRTLLKRGIAVRYVRRLVSELEMHYDDLLERALSRGLPQADAEREASQQLGNADDLIAGYVARPELHTFSRRHPMVAQVAGPIALLTLSLTVAVAMSLWLGLGTAASLQLLQQTMTTHSQDSQGMKHDERIGKGP